MVCWHKRQSSCREKPCPRKVFTEQIAELPAGARVTGRLRRHVAGRVADGLAVSVAGNGLISWPISHAAWFVHADQALVEPEPVTVLGIDETRRGRPSWVREELTGKWRLTERFETNVVLNGPQGLLGQSSGRTKAPDVAWLDKRGQVWEDTVEIIAVDPCASCRTAVQHALPHARIVTDHFHLVRLANQATTSAGASPGTPTAGEAARPTRRGPPADGCFAAGSGCRRCSSSGCGTT